MAWRVLVSTLTIFSCLIYFSIKTNINNKIINGFVSLQMEAVFENGLDAQRKRETFYLRNNRVEHISWRINIKYLLTLMYKIHMKPHPNTKKQHFEHSSSEHISHKTFSTSFTYLMLSNISYHTYLKHFPPIMQQPWLPTPMALPSYYSLHQSCISVLSNVVAKNR